MSEQRQIQQQIVVSTTPEMAFEALIAASELREWFCDEARTEVRPGGRYEVRWNQGYRAEGQFVEIDPPRRAAITWLGGGEPGETRVQFRVEPASGGVAVSVLHGGFGPGSEWDEALAEAEKGWAGGLENLKSILETGIDLRVARQPFMGILPGVLDAERADREGIAAEAGIYVGGTLEGMAASAAGLQKGDVIVSFGGSPTPGFAELNAALRTHQSGDVVDLEIVRGQERQVLQLVLGPRPQGDVADTAEGLARFAAEQYAQTDAELQAALEGLSDEDATCCPVGGEWSVKQVLAHLLIGERDTQAYLAAIALDGWQDGGAGNPTTIPGRLAAVQAVTPTLEGLVAAYLAAEAEMVAFLRGLPDDTVAHKARFRRICQNIAFAPLHTRDHIEQIKAIVVAVQGSQGPAALS